MAKTPVPVKPKLGQSGARATGVRSFGQQAADAGNQQNPTITPSRIGHAIATGAKKGFQVAAAIENPVGTAASLYGKIPVARPATPVSDAGSNGPMAVPARPKTAPKKSATSVSSMQQFLVGKGYNIAVDGINGPLTQAAAADFRGSRNPTAFNVGHGLVEASSATEQPFTRADATQQQQTARNAFSTGAHPTPESASTKSGATAPSLGQASKSGFYSTKAQAQAVLPPDMPGAVVKFQQGKGYYIGDSAPTRATASAGAATPSLMQQASGIVQTELDPILKQIQAIETARSTQGQNAITGYTTAEQQLLGNEPGIASAAYGGAMQGQNAIDAAIANTLQGSGTANADALGAKLAQIAADPGTAGRINGQTAADLAGNVGAQYASHSATLSALNQEGAAAQNYLKAQPGIAGLAGLQSSKALQGQINQDTQTQLGNVTSQVPTMVQNLYSALLSAQTEQQKNQIAAIISSGFNPATGQLTPQARAALASATGVDPVTGKPTAKVAATRAAATAKANAPSSGLSGRVGYLVSAAGKPILDNQGHVQILPGFTIGANGQIVKVQKPTAAKGQLTDTEISKMVTGWHDGGTKTIRVPVVDSNGNPVTNSNGVPQTMPQTVSVGTMGYRQAYKQLRAFGVTDPKARAVLDTKYKRGDEGRAWLTNEEQATLRKAGVPATAATVKGHGGILRAPQVKALKAAGQLPAGQATSDGFYVIAQTY